MMLISYTVLTVEQNNITKVFCILTTRLTIVMELLKKRLGTKTVSGRGGGYFTKRSVLCGSSTQ